MANSEKPDNRPAIITEETVCDYLRGIDEFEHESGPKLILIESLDGYTLLDCLLPEHLIADMTLRCVGPVCEGNGFVCNGFMVQGDRLLRVTVTVRNFDLCEITDANYVGQILRREQIGVVSARLFPR